MNRLTREIVGSETKYGLIPADHWNQASFIDETKASAYRKQAEADGVMYGGKRGLQRIRPPSD